MRRRTRRPTRVRTGLCAVFCAALLPLLAGAAFAETPEEVAQQLDDRLFFAKALGRGGDALIKDVEKKLSEVGDSDGLINVRASACVWRGQQLITTGDPKVEDQAITYLELVADGAKSDPQLIEDATTGLVTIHLGRGKRYEDAKDDKNALAAYIQASKRDRSNPLPYTKMGSLGERQVADRESQQDFDGALGVLGEVRELLSSSGDAAQSQVARLNSIEKRILGATGVVTFKWLGSLEQMKRVKGGFNQFVGGSIKFTKTSGGQAPPPELKVTEGAAYRIRTGGHSATLHGSAEGTLPLPIHVESTGTAVVIPVAVPHGMVLVHGGSLNPFLIDRTEVPISQFRDFASKNGIDVPGNSGNLPARGMSFAQALAFAQSVGKDLPTLEQWRWAAVGRPDGKTQTYPWGEATPVPGKHFVGGVSAPQVVDSLARDGASAFGAINLVGNVMEWIKPGWAIGGRWTMTEFERTVRPEDSNPPPWTANLIRDPIPTKYDVLNGGALPGGRAPEFYPDSFRLPETAYVLVGLRCVIPLGTPRETPK